MRRYWTLACSTGFLLALLWDFQMRQAEVSIPTENTNLNTQNTAASPDFAPKIVPLPNRSPSAQPSDTILKFSIRTALKDGIPKLTPLQIQHYLDSHPNDPAAALAAFQLTEDLELLKKSAREFPNHAPTQFELYCRSKNPDERRAALDAFLKADPSNALAAYCSGIEKAKSENPKSAVEDFVAADNLTFFDPYSESSRSQIEDAYRMSGYSEAVAKLAAYNKRSFSASVDWQIYDALKEVSGSYLKEGDPQGAYVMQGMQLKLAQKLQSDPSLINQYLGYQIQEHARIESPEQEEQPRALSDLDLFGAYKLINITLDDVQLLADKATEADLLQFFALEKKVGEREALKRFFAK